MLQDELGSDGLGPGALLPLGSLWKLKGVCVCVGGVSASPKTHGAVGALPSSCSPSSRLGAAWISWEALRSKQRERALPPEVATVVPPYPRDTRPKTPSGCLKPRTVPNPGYTVFSYMEIPTITFNL